jgi:hypothetical protein
VTAQSEPATQRHSIEAFSAEVFKVRQRAVSGSAGTCIAQETKLGLYPMESTSIYTREHVAEAWYT